MEDTGGEKLTRKEEIKKRRDLIKEYLRQQPNKTQEQIIDYLVKKGMPHYGQATIQRDLKELHFINTDKGYKHITPQKREEAADEQLRQCLTFDGNPRIHALPLFTVSIKVQNGTASRIAQIIDRKYGNKITGTIAGEGLVLIFTTKEERAKKIAREMKELLTQLAKIESSNEDYDTCADHFD